MRNTMNYVPDSFLSDLTPEAFDEMIEELEMLFAAAPEIHPYGSRLAELPAGWGVVNEDATKH